MICKVIIISIAIQAMYFHWPHQVHWDRGLYKNISRISFICFHWRKKWGRDSLKANLHLKWALLRLPGCRMILAPGNINYFLLSSFVAYIDKVQGQLDAQICSAPRQKEASSQYKSNLHIISSPANIFWFHP